MKLKQRARYSVPTTVSASESGACGSDLLASMYADRIQQAKRAIAWHKSQPISQASLLAIKAQEMAITRYQARLEDMGAQS